MRRLRTILPVLVVAASLVLAACGGPAPTPTSAPTPTRPPATPTSPATGVPAVAAQQVFAANCASCHGAQRQGTTGLGPAVTAAALAGKSEADVRKVIAEGKTGTMMPAWKGMLTDAEIDALAKFLKGQ